MKTQKLRFKINFWLLICNFTFCILAFGFLNHAYALNLEKIKISFLKGDYNVAIQEGEKILASAGHSKDIDELYYLLGISYLKEGDYLRASDIFEIILKEFKDSEFSEEAELGLGDAYFFKGDYEKARLCYEELIRNYPATKLRSSAYYRLIQVGFKTDNPREAKDYSDILKQEFPQSHEVKINPDLFSLSDFYYTVQVGAFSNSVNATNLASKLINQGYEAYTQESEAGGKKVYRVRVGKLKSRSEATQLESKLASEGYPTKIIP